MRIRTACLNDLPAMMDLYAQARRFMAQNGNADQWGSNYPDEKIVREDIESGFACVCEENGRVIACFLLAPGPDPTYEVIRNGEWLQKEQPYWVVHRVAVGEDGKGVGTYCLKWCMSRHRNIRIDTHKDNKPMQKLLKKCGFSYCGVISCADGGERIAFQVVL